MDPDYEPTYGIPMSIQERRDIEDKFTVNEKKYNIIFSDLGVCVRVVKEKIEKEVLNVMKEIGTQVFYEDCTEECSPKNEKELRQNIKHTLEKISCHSFEKEDNGIDWSNDKETFFDATICEIRTSKKGMLYAYEPGYIQEFLRKYDYPDVSGVPHYQTHDNGGRPFTVFDVDVDVDKNLAVILKIPSDDVEENDQDYDQEDDVDNFTVCVGTYEYTQFFVGKDYLHPEWRQREGLLYPGNSVLLKIQDNRYVFVGDCIYEFDTLDGDVIVDYHSLVGNNDVPYPVALGEKYAYFMLDRKCIPLSEIPKEIQESMFDAYTFFYGHTRFGKPKITLPLGNVNLIHNRSW
jgi:hypothetical protein